MSSEQDRRRFLRVTLPDPVRGAVGSARIYVLDASMGGVRIAHQSALPAPGGFCRLEMWTPEGPVKLDCEIVRTAVAQKPQQLFHSGLQIVAADRQSAERLRSICGDEPPPPPEQNH